MRDLSELVVADSVWPDVVAAVDAAGDGAAIVPADEDGAGECLRRLQITTRSVLGSVAYHAGGLVVDYGWVRLLGAGHGALPSIAAANGLHHAGDASPPWLVVGFDVLGGRIALNGGGLQGVPGEVNLWAADDLAWQALGVQYSEFVMRLLEGAGADLYQSLRWTGWESEVARVGLGEGLHLYPPPCTAEGRDVAAASRRPVPWSELTAWLDTLAAIPEGARFRIDPTP